MARLQSNGIELEYDIRGQGPALLFIHGLGSTLHDWRAQADVFAQHYRVITFDLRGHGQSDKPEGPYSIAMFAADAAGVLQGLSISSAHVVGISLGGTVAFQMVLDYPELVNTVTIVNSGPDASVRGFKTRLAVWLRFYMVRKFGLPTAGKTIAAKLFPQPENRQVRDEFVARFAKNDTAAYLHAFRALLGWSVIDRIAGIGRPLLAITADRDYTPLAFKEAYVAKIPGAKLEVVKDTHHALPMEKPQEFNAVLERFLMAHC